MTLVLMGRDAATIGGWDKAAVGRRDRAAVGGWDPAAVGGWDPAATGEPGAGDVGDVGELYRAFSRRLEQIVRAGVRAPDWLIEEACQFAWARLVHHQGRVRRETALAWLIRTALREAVKLSGRGRRELSLDAALRGHGEIPAPDPGPAAVCEQREQLRAVSALSLRQQRLLWLYALGLSYEEIAVRDGCSSRTVERQLQRGRAALRATAAQ